jgi:hypothetical protein
MKLSKAADEEYFKQMLFKAIATRAKDGKEWSRFVFLRLKHGMAEAAQEIKRASDHAAIVAIDFLVCSSFE